MNRRGFTLIEVTLAIAVGAVLIAFSIAAFKQYRDGARVQQGKLNLATIRQAMAMYRYRRGIPMPLGYAGFGTIAGTNVNLTQPLPNLPTVHGLTTATPVCIAGVAYNLAAAPAPGANQLSLSAAPPVTSGQVLAGVRGNIDDQCQKLMPVSPPGASTLDGMGLSDPWMGYTDVRPNPGAGDLPQYFQGAGFRYDPTRPNDRWGGLAYFNNTGDVEYVLPDPTSGNTSDLKKFGYFPGDPPVSWGK